MALTEFLTARIAEDEERARSPYLRTVYVGQTRADVRELAECDAKRRIVTEHATIDAGQWGDACGRCADWITPAAGYPEANTVDAPCATLRLLALPYADHPDYDQTWRV